MARARSQEPWLQKRGDVWYAFWYDAERRHERRKSLDTSDHVTAVARFAEFLVKGVDDPSARRGIPGLKPTVAQVLDWYEKNHLEAVEGPVSAERQLYAIAPLKRFFAARAIGDVDIESSRAYRLARVKGLCGRPVSDSTIRRELGVLIAAANHAHDWKRLKADELPHIELPTEAGAEDKKPWLTKASIRIIFDKAEGDLNDFCRLTYYWASRRDAVERLHKAQVDLQHSRVDLHKAGERRTRKRKPIVPIYPEIRPFIERRMIEADNHDGWLFPATSHLAARPYAEFYTAFKKLCDDHNIKAVDAGEGDVPWPHLLRHSRASHMLMDGESIYKVAKLLGDTVATVEKVYGHHSAEFLATQSTIEDVA
jgi:integrase